MDKLHTQTTQLPDLSNRYRIKSYILGEYQLEIIVDQADRFIGVQSIKMNKSFLDISKIPQRQGKSAEEILKEYFDD